MKSNKKFKKAEMFAWMPLTGFDKNLSDKGVGQLMDRVGFELDGVCLFVFHPDIIHQHRGMNEEVILPPDNCSYYANPYNEERRRQQWSNHDLRDLASRLRQRDTECFISIMGITLDDYFHKEWISEHPEIKTMGEDGAWGIDPLKRFADGTYYEDFFADKLCEVMLDYGFSGIHVSDAFCPQGGNIAQKDFSYDMLDQFVSATGYPVPEFLINDKSDTIKSIAKRRDWIWSNCREEWIRFRASRWNGFWKKICDRMHSIGRKVFVLGMYCTDPFDTLYTKGVDLRGIVQAGVDYIMPNMHANTSLIARKRPWRYYEWANMMSLTDAFTNSGKKLNMLSVKDAAEQWDMLHHAPNLLDRDIVFLPTYIRHTADGKKRCLDGYNICLADGIYKEEWKWLRERFDVAFDNLPKRILTPTLVWSDYAFDRTLPEYIRTRRWTLHKFIYEVNKLGAHCAGIVRTEHITDECGDIFVPNFDLLSPDEKEAIVSYKGGAVIATAAAENFCKDDYNIDFYFEDKNSPYPMCAFVINGKISDKDCLVQMLEKDDGTKGIADVTKVEETKSTLDEFMPYQKVSTGFVESLATLLKSTYSDILESTHPIIPMQMEDGRIRVYALNDDLLRYAEANITVKSPIKKVDNVSKFPLLPVKFSDTGDFSYRAKDFPGNMRTFRLLITQGGVSVVDIHI